MTEEKGDKIKKQNGADDKAAKRAEKRCL